MSLLISGPVGIDVLKYNNIKIILLYDRHFSLEGVCNTTCSDEALPDKDLPDDVLPCYTASGIIDKVIKNADTKGQYVDVYLESQWAEVKKQSELLEARREQKRLLGLRPPSTGTKISPSKDSLGLTKIRYSNCLYEKALCPYRNARFHYVDIRSIPTKRISNGILDEIRYFYEEMVLSHHDLYKKGGDTLKTHLEYFSFEFIIKTFMNTDRFMDSNLWTYYDFVINSDNFTEDINSWLDSLLNMDNQYIEKTIKLLAYRYPEYSLDFIKSSVETKIQSTFALIKSSFLVPLYVTERNIVISDVVYKVNVHKIRNQLLQLELQGDSERAESLRLFVYRKLNLLGWGGITNLFDLYNKIRMIYISTRRIDNQPNITIENGGIESLGSYDALMMDLYTLARMFRTYPQEFRNPNKDHVRHVSPSYIIEYAGAYHIRNVIEYLTSVGVQKVPFALRRNGDRCLRVPNDIFDWNNNLQ